MCPRHSQLRKDHAASVKRYILDLSPVTNWGAPSELYAVTYQELDFIFPFIVLGYGAVMTITMNFEPLVRIAEQRFPPQLLHQMNAHRGLGVICLVVGAVWTLQNLWNL